MIISDEIRQAIIEQYENGIDTKTQLADKYGVSPRSVGRIIEKYLTEKLGNYDTDTDIEIDETTDTQETETKAVPIINLWAMGGNLKTEHEFPFTKEEAHTHGYEVSEYFKQFLDDLHRQADEIGAMCETLQQVNTPYNLENNRRTLVGLIRRLNWYELDTANVNLRIHKAEVNDNA